jgi:hypothetical protein
VFILYITKTKVVIVKTLFISSDIYRKKLKKSQPMAKILHESLIDYRKANGLDRTVELNEEQQLNESISGQYEKLDKNNKAKVKEFVNALVAKKYVAPGGASSPKEALQAIVNKKDLAACLAFLKTAVEDGFSGRPVLGYADAANKTGRKLVWKAAKDIKLANQFAGGGTNQSAATGYQG